MTPSVPRRILAALLGVLAFASPARPDAVSDARAALAAGDFAAMKSALDPVLDGAPANTPAYDDARVLRAIARVGLVASDSFPGFLRTKFGANVARLDPATGDLAVRFPRPAFFLSHQGGVPIPGFTTAGPAFYQHDPELNLYMTGGAQPSIAFENTGAASAPLTFTITQPEGAAPLYEAALYLDGQLLGFALATPGFPTEIFVLPAFHSLEPQIPDPFDLDASTPASFLRPGANPGSFTVQLPPKSNLTIGLVVSGGNLRFTPAATLPASIVVRNARAGAITLPRLASTANFSDFVGFAINVDSATLAPAIADLAAASTGLSLALSPEETGSARDIVIAYPDAQLLVAELKFLQAIRRLSPSYNFNLPIKPALLDAKFSQLVAKNPAFLTPLPPTAARSADRLAARTLIEEACDHYTAASDAGLWSRGAPLSGAYLFSLAEEDPDAASTQKDIVDSTVGQFRVLLSEPVPIDDTPGGASVSLAALFGSPAINVRGIIPLSTDKGFIRGSSTPLLASGLIQNYGTAAWEQLLAKNDLLDLSVSPLLSAAKIQRNPAALTEVAEGDPASLRVVAESYPAPTYQWFRRKPDGTKLAIAGASRPVLHFEETSREDAGRYFVEVTNERVIPPKTTPTRITVASTTAVLYVTYAPEIVTPPAGAVRYAGKNVTLAVAAVGEPKPKFQWFKGDTAVTTPRANPNYTFSASTARAGDYRVEIENTKGKISSAPVTVEVQTKPVFTTQPLAQTASIGGNVTFTAAATGNPTPQIKWRKDGKDLGVTGPVLTLNSITKANAGVYTAVAFSTVQTGPSSTTVVSTASNGAKLTVSTIASINPDFVGVFRDQVPAE